MAKLKFKFELQLDWLRPCPKRPKPTTHHENHKNIIYYQYFSILEKAFSPSRNNLFVADSCSEVHRNKVLHIVEYWRKEYVTFDRRFIVFSASEHAPQCIWVERQAKKTSLQYFLQLNKYFYDLNTLNPFAKSLWDTHRATSVIVGEYWK